VEYSGYVCPFCGRHFSQTLPALLEQYDRTGQVQFLSPVSRYPFNVGLRKIIALEQKRLTHGLS
jgi:hypothetical protein